DLRRHHHRLLHPGLSVCDSADHPVRRRLVLGHLSIERPYLRGLVAVPLVEEDRGLLLASDAAAYLPGSWRLCHDDASDQNLAPRRNSQAIWADRGRQGQ